MLDFPVCETMLDNGLKVLTVEHRAAPITSVWIWYRVGSRNERPGITGISHWVEHMCFKGGKEFGKGDIFREVAKAGGYNNGMTSTDYTVYFETLPAAYGELGLRIEADRLANSRFDPDEVAAERTVIISEREGAENWPQFLLGEELALAALRTHPYRWSVIGWKADLRKITHAELWEYYKNWYTPDNAVLVVVGDFETSDMLLDIRRLFGEISGTARRTEVRSEEPPQEGERRVYLRRPGTASYLQIAYHIPSGTHEDRYALQVLNSILAGTGSMGWNSPSGGGYRTCRLYRALVETELAVGAGCSIIPHQVDPGLGVFSATVRVNVAPERVEEAMLQVIARAAAEPPDAEELQRAKTQIYASMAYAGESATGIASMVGHAEMVGGYEQLRVLQEKVEAVSAEDVLRVAQTYFTENNRTVGWFIPTGEPTAGTAGTSPAPQFRCFHFTGLEIFRAARRRTLDNGVRVVAARCATTPSVSVTGMIRGGALLDSEAEAGRARFSAAMMDRGTATRTYQQIYEQLDAVGATLFVGAGQEALRFDGNALAEHLDLVLSILADVLMNPTFPEQELEKVRSEILTSLRQDADSTQRVALRRARLLLYPPGHPYRVWDPGTEESIASLKREDLAAYYASAVRPEEAIVVLVGDVDPEQAIGMVEEKLGGWESQRPAPAIASLSAEPPDNLVTDCTVMSNKTQCDIVLASTGVPRTHPDYYALHFATQVLGRLGFMGRFGKTVRDELGLAYYVFATSPETSGDGMWTAQAGVNPRNVQLAIDTMVQQMRTLQEQLATEGEYDELVQHELGALAMRVETKGSIASSLLAIERWDLGPDYFERYPAIVRAVSREAMREAAQKYFRPEKHVRVVVGPECG